MEKSKVVSTIPKSLRMVKARSSRLSIAAYLSAIFFSFLGDSGGIIPLRRWILPGTCCSGDRSDAMASFSFVATLLALSSSTDRRRRAERTLVLTVVATVETFSAKRLAFDDVLDHNFFHGLDWNTGATVVIGVVSLLLLLLLSVSAAIVVVVKGATGRPAYSLSSF